MWDFFYLQTQVHIKTAKQESYYLKDQMNSLDTKFGKDSCEEVAELEMALEVRIKKLVSAAEKTTIQVDK